MNHLINSRKSAYTKVTNNGLYRRSFTLALLISVISLSGCQNGSYSVTKAYSPDTDSVKSVLEEQISNSKSSSAFTEGASAIAPGTQGSEPLTSAREESASFTSDTYEASGALSPDSSENVSTDLSSDSYNDLSTSEGNISYGRPDPDYTHDLSVMGSDMIYAAVYDLVTDYESHVNETYKIRGRFYSSIDPKTMSRYYFCVINDALGCCSQGLEFLLADADAVYPENYPKEGSEILLTGTWSNYNDPSSGDDFYALTDASFTAPD